MVLTGPAIRQLRTGNVRVGDNQPGNVLPPTFAINFGSMRSYRRLFAVLLLALCSCRNTTAPLPGSGEEWRRMSQREKQIFVGAFLDGNTSGNLRLCNALEAKVAVLKFQDGVAASDHPCLQFGPVFTHGDTKAAATLHYVDPYVAVVDNFYTHPECRVMPYHVVMQHLDDAEFKSGADLYRSVRDGSASWGLFSGFDGMENCYGVDRNC